MRGVDGVERRGLELKQKRMLPFENHSMEFGNYPAENSWQVSCECLGHQGKKIELYSFPRIQIIALI